MIDVRKLGMLAALDRLGTIAAVAEELCLTAPGISMQLSGLERELGIVLTERQGRRLALTPAGKILAAHGREVLDRLSLTELEVDALRRGASGSFRVAAFPSAARTFVADAWRMTVREGTGIQIALTTPEPEGALSALVAGETDLAIVHSYSNMPRRLPSGVEATLVASELVWLAMRADDMVSDAIVDLAALHDHAWITPSRGVTCFDMVDRACGLAGFRPRIVAETMDFSVQLELVAAGVGVALVPDLTVGAVPHGVLIRRLREPVKRTTLAVRRRSMHGDPGLDRLVAMLDDAARNRIRTEAPR